MFLAIFLALVVSCAGAGSRTNLVVQTESGAVLGASSSGVESFKGIPYAAPPVGALRWHAPMPPENWADVRDATDFVHDCMQIEYPTELSPLQTGPSEDCLYLNVWRPAGTEAGAKLPILVWIHGGGFVNGGTSAPPYSGAPMAKKGLVVVSMNYRMGRFGFFAHPAISAAKEGPVGNWGFMDQMAALEWVQRNADAFGGDADAVTIMGESAGGMSVLTLMGAPEARDIFHGAIVMSGVGRSLGPTRQLTEDLPGIPSSETIGVRFAESLGIEGTGPDALKRLRSLSAEDVLGDLYVRNMGVENYAGSAVDGITVVDSVENIFARGEQAKVPVMIGATSMDLGSRNFASKEEAFAIFGEDAAAAKQDYDPTGDVPLEVIADKIGADFVMVEPARYIARQVTQAGEPAYYYRFSYIADKDKPDSPYGAAHATDVAFFLNTAAARYGEYLTSTDQAMASVISEYVVNFVRSGVPSAEGQSNWPAIGSDDMMMHFTGSGEVVVATDPWKSRLDRIENMASSKTE